MRNLTQAGLVIVTLGFWMTGALAENMPAVPTLDGPVADRSLVCMIDDNLQKNPGLEYVYQGKTYYLCCAGCLKRFGSDPERFSHAIDPVSGESVDKAEASIYGYAGKAFFFSNEAHLKAFAAEPGRFFQQPSSKEDCSQQGASADMAACR